MTSTSFSIEARRRNPVVVTIDILVSVVLLVLTAGIALGVITTAVTFLKLPTSNPVVLNIVSYALMGVAIFGLFGAFGMVIVNVIRKRFTFWWPLGAVVAIIGLYYVGAWILSLSVTA